VNYRHAFGWVVIVLLAVSCGGQGKEPHEITTNLFQGSQIQVATDQQPVPARGKRENYAPGELLVKFVDGTDEGTMQAIQNQLQLKTIRIVSKSNLYLMKIMSDTSVEQMINLLRGFQAVVYAEPNYIRRIQ
jgi:hypothetical protein